MNEWNKRYLLEILAAEFLLQELGEMLLADGILQKFLQAERPPADPLRLDFFPNYQHGTARPVQKKKEKKKKKKKKKRNEMKWPI